MCIRDSVYDVKTQKLQVRTPCKCCSRSQKRSIPGLRLRLTPLLAVIERVCEYHILSLLLLLLIYMTKHISHTCGRKLQARAIFVKKYSQPYVQAVSCNSSSSVFLNQAFIKSWKTSAVGTKLNFSSCVVHQTHSLDVLILYFIYNTWYGFCELNLRYD